MRITITIETDNDAFKPQPWVELRRIFRVMVPLIASCRQRGYSRILDINGIAVGGVEVSE